MWCDEKVYSRHTVIFKTLSDLDRLNDSLQIKNAIDDLKNFHNYPVTGGSKVYYGIDSVYYYHETYHKNDFIRIANEVYYNSDLYKKFADTVKSCSEVGSLLKFTQMATQYIENKKSDFRSALRKSLTDIMLDNKDVYEKDTQIKAYKEIVQPFIKALNKKLEIIRNTRIK